MIATPAILKIEVTDRLGTSYLTPSIILNDRGSVRKIFSI